MRVDNEEALPSVGENLKALIFPRKGEEKAHTRDNAC